MSQKSNGRKSQRGNLPHHEMKRGLNNWGKGYPSVRQMPKNSEEPDQKKELDLQKSIPPQTERDLTLQSPLDLARTTKSLKKQNKRLIL